MIQFTQASANKLWITPMVKSFLQDAHSYHWTVQGMGMMRMYFGNDKECRLSIWHPSLRLNPKPTMIHDHPWDFWSIIVAGRLINVRYEEVKENGSQYIVQMIRPGEGMHPITKPETTMLKQTWTECYGPGDAYGQNHDDIHETDFGDVAITVVARDRKTLPDLARVFWPAGDVFRSAKPRAATPDEIGRVTRDALTVLEK